MPDIFQAFTLEQVLQVGIAMLLVFAGIVSISFVIWWGFLMIVSGGAEEKVKTAVNHIRHAVMGVLFIIAVLYIMPTFLGLIGSEYADTLRPVNIYGAMAWLTDQIFWQTTDTWLWNTNDFDGSLPDDFSDF